MIIVNSITFKERTIHTTFRDRTFDIVKSKIQKIRTELRVKFKLYVTKGKTNGVNVNSTLNIKKKCNS